jgi:hypothetical protein
MRLHCQRLFITKNSEVTICSSHKGIIISVACRASGFVQQTAQDRPADFIRWLFGAKRLTTSEFT